MTDQPESLESAAPPTAPPEPTGQRRTAVAPAPEQDRTRPQNTAVAFVRVRSDTGEHLNLIDAQRATNTATADQLNATIRREYLHVGSTHPLPDAVLEMLTDLALDPVDYLIVADFDRLTRDIQTADHILRELSSSGVYLALPDRVVESASLSGLVYKYRDVYAAIEQQEAMLEQQEAMLEAARANGLIATPADLDGPTPGQQLAAEIRAGLVDVALLEAVITDAAGAGWSPSNDALKAALREVGCAEGPAGVWRHPDAPDPADPEGGRS